MRLGDVKNSISCEFEMQSALKKWLTEKNFKFIDELKVAEVSRIPDFLVFVPGNGLVNIEAKCHNHEEILRQLRDNSIYCNYSFAYIPDYCLTSKYFKTQLLNSGYGLMVYNYQYKIITEVLESHVNKAIDRNLQKIVLQRIDSELIRRKKLNDIDTQKSINYET